MGNLLLAVNVVVVRHVVCRESADGVCGLEEVSRQRGIQQRGIEQRKSSEEDFVHEKTLVESWSRWLSKDYFQLLHRLPVAIYRHRSCFRRADMTMANKLHRRTFCIKT